MNQKRPAAAPPPPEDQDAPRRFQDLMNQVLRVSKEELARREDAYRRSREDRKQQK